MRRGENLKKILGLMEDGRSIVFIDECHFYQHGTRIRAWYPSEDHDPVVLQKPNRKGISVFGAVRIDNGKLLTRFTDKYNAMTFLEFLCVVYKRFPNTLIVLDNALYQRAGIVTYCAFLTGMDLLFMPPYSLS